ncbi:MAG: 16S rRNA (guanine(527)-N(7))-methyltransferase RsmG [Thermoflexales bacterium]
MNPGAVRQAAQAMGITLTSEQAAQFAHYAALLNEWNMRFNLTRITTDADVLALHFLDSLTALPVVQALVEAAQPARLLDVGSGAGLPGIPLKIALPTLDVTLLDSTAKKLLFCQAVIDALQLHGIRTLHARAEAIAHVPEHREQYHVVIARAVAPLPTLVEYLLPLARVGGACVAMKGSHVADELQAALGAIALMGGAPPEVQPASLPGRPERRALVIIRKERPTPARFPRRSASLRRKPLQ